METNASNLPIRLLSVMKIAFIQLPVKVDNIFHDYSPPGEKEQKLVKKYFRQIDRALNSGIAIINETLNIRQNQIAVSSEEERIEAQIENNILPMQLVEFWLREENAL